MEASTRLVAYVDLETNVPACVYSHRRWAHHADVPRSLLLVEGLVLCQLCSPLPPTPAAHEKKPVPRPESCHAKMHGKWCNYVSRIRLGKCLQYLGLSTISTIYKMA